MLTKFGDTVSVKDFGAVGDGVTDDRAAIQTAVNSCITLGKILFFPDGVYAMSSFTNSALGAQIVAAPTGDVKMTANSATILCTAATQAAFMFYFQNTSGYDLDISGITFDANLLAQVCLKRDEYSQGVASVLIDKCTFTNAYGVVTGAPVASPLWYTSSGVELYGGFRFVSVTNSQFINIKRASGGTVDYATTGFGIGLDQNGTTYPQNINVSGCYFADINNNQILDVATNANADGLKIFGGYSLGASYIASTATISNNHFVNCQGRAIKVQNDESTIFGNTVRYAVRPISGGTSQINCQLECGIISNNVFHYDAAPSNTNPFAITFGDTGHSPISFYSGSAASRARMYTATNNIVLNNVPTATGVMLAFIGWTEGAVSSLPVYATIEGNKISGKMKVFCNPTTRTSGGVVFASITNNYMTELVSAFMASGSGSNFANTRFDITGNVNSGSTVAHLVDVSDYTTILVANFSAERNVGIGLTASKLNINGAGFLSRTGTLVDPEYSSGGGMTVQSMAIAQDATYLFPRCTYMKDGASLRLLTSSYGGATNILFLHGDQTLTAVSAVPARITLGSTSDPSPPSGKFGVWIDTTTGGINVKNKTTEGSFVVTLITLG
jgi:hypothetical protein